MNNKTSAFSQKYISALVQEYPSAKEFVNLEQNIDYLVSPQIVTLPRNVLERVRQSIADIYKYAHSPSRIEKLYERLTTTEKQVLDCRSHVKNSSVLMAYDFHYHKGDDQLSLIEINTNASAFLLSELIYRMDELTTNIWPSPIENLKKSFFQELTKMSKAGQNVRAVILDETPEAQKMYVEFLMFRDLFKSWGWETQIADPAQTSAALNAHQIDFVYNRYTNFNLEGPSAEGLFNYFQSGQAVFSPNPIEYLLLAEKKNLIEFADAKLSDVLIPTLNITADTDIEGLWAQRKKYVFKPHNLYGAKGVYKGSSISRRMFDDIVKQNFLAQEFRPPGEVDNWKYDLRFYVYQNEIHLGVARLYQGQVTNFKTPGGGLARINFQ